MLVFKVVYVFLLALLVGAEKKIELQDIEEDNLRSEKEKGVEKSEPRSQSSGPGTAAGIQPLEFLKSGLLRYFESPVQPTQQPRYIQQYAVSEPPEKAPVIAPKAQHAIPAPQQAMVGYLSNVPMQIYLVPQYYNDPSEQAANPQPEVRYTAPGVARVTTYQTAPEAVQPQTNYVEVPAYVAPTGKTYLQPYTSPITYVSYTPQPTVAPVQATVGPVLAYPMPVVQYPTAIAAPPVVPKGYYSSSQYTDTSAVEEVQENEVESSKQYSTQTEIPYKSLQEYPRYYSSRAPIREEPRHSPVSELPPPNPLILKSSPPHLSHIPKTLPVYSRPLTKPVYATGSGIIPSAFSSKPSEAYGVPYRRRPASLLDSYIPSSVQVEYLKRGYAKDPLAVYEALSSGRQFPHSSLIPRYYEQGFLPNQMYHTAAGGVTYGHYKRTPKLEKSAHK